MKHANATYVGEGRILYFPTTALIDNRPWFYLDANDVRSTPEILLGQYEVTWLDRFVKSIEEGNTVIDVGANIGWYAMHAANKVGPKGNVIAIEPHPKAFEFLRMNMETNSYNDRMKLWPGIVSDKMGGDSKFWFDNSFTLGSHISGLGTHPKGNDGHEMTINTYTLDHIVEELEIDYAIPSSDFVIKVDVEGAEYNVWQGMQKLLKHASGVQLFIELHIYALTKPFDDFIREINNKGLTCRLYNDNGRQTNILGERAYLHAYR